MSVEIFKQILREVIEYCDNCEIRPADRACDSCGILTAKEALKKIILGETAPIIHGHLGRNFATGKDC